MLFPLRYRSPDSRLEERNQTPNNASPDSSSWMRRLPARGRKDLRKLKAWASKEPGLFYAVASNSRAPMRRQLMIRFKPMMQIERFGLTVPSVLMHDDRIRELLDKYRLRVLEEPSPRTFRVAATKGTVAWIMAALEREPGVLEAFALREPDPAQPSAAGPASSIQAWRR